MSDFVRIMRGWTAMCDKYSNCYPCPLNGKGACMRPINNRRVQDMIRTEQIVENWLKDHPLPSTPTWIKWLSEHGIIDSIEDGNVKLFPLAYYPMDEEIAAKLGELENG